MTVHQLPRRQKVDVAANARAEVARAQITQQQIADALGENQAWVSRRLVGQVEFRVSELLALADVIGVHPAVLLGGQAPSPRTGPGGWAPRGSNPEPTGYGVRRRLMAVPA